MDYKGKTTDQQLMHTLVDRAYLQEPNMAQTTDAFVDGAI